MAEGRRFGVVDLAALLLVVAGAGGLRSWYLVECADYGYETPALEVQGQMPLPAHPAGHAPRQPTEFDALIDNLKAQRGFVSRAPLADQEEKTAHVAPAYPWLVSQVARWDVAVEAAVRWGQAGLGTLTAGCYFLFARRAFASLLVGFLAGMLAAVHPFWIINTGELADGVLATFLLAASLALGTRASHAGGAFTSLLYGLALAALAMTRAALLPFTLVALLWFLWRARTLRGGWFCALVALLGFGNGLAPWAVRNYRDFEEPLPIVDSAMLHLWIGNNSQATGGPLEEETLRKSLPPERLAALLAEPNQPRRYAALGPDVLDALVSEPSVVGRRRLWSGLMFFFGASWFTSNSLSATRSGAEIVAPPEWVDMGTEAALGGALLLMLVVGVLGWRFSFAWRRQARLATLAAVWVPLPYLMTHADTLAGPRLPLDGVLLCFVAYALVSWLPGVCPRDPA